ncbi:MAG: hypothetical protein AAGD25_37275 [Cyanobacteria bacterium P01_F01_bin.150]
MSHYLQSIAARSLDSVPKVEPRLAARFESGMPVTGAVNLAGEEQDRTEAPCQRLSLPKDTEVGRPPSPAVAEGPVVSSQPRGTESLVTPIEPSRPPLTMGSIASVSQAFPPDETIRPAEPVSPIFTSPQPSETICPSLPTAHHVPPSGIFAEEPNDSLISSGSTNLPQASRAVPNASSFSQKASPQALRQDSQTIQPVPVDASLPKTPVPVVQSMEIPTGQAAIPPAQRVSSPSPPAPPPIQVTIGRIEVRAVSSPSRPRAIKPAVPKRSLNDYLKARQQALGGRG